MVFLACVAAPAYAKADVILWVPEHMIAGEQYEGVVISEATPRGSLVLLSAGDDAINIQESVSILPYQNHGIFSVAPIHEGTADVFAAIDGQLYSVSTQVYSKKSEASGLQIVIPANKTKADSMLGYVMLVDEGGSPAPANENLRIGISTTQAIDAPDTITIRNGTTLKAFEMDIGGTGHIIASADQLDSYKTHIEKIQDGFTLRMAIAPDIAMENSYAFYYVWLEKEQRPFVPPYVVDAFVHSSNADIARLNTNPYVTGSDGFQIHLVDGVAKGILYTGNRGYATITASAGFGTAHDTIFVGPAKIGNTGDSATIKIQEQNFVVRDDTEHEPNLILSWIYPDVTSESAWGVAATYHINKTQSLELFIDDVGKMDGAISQGATITPASSHGTVYVSSSDGLEHDGVYLLEQQHITKTNAIEFEITGDHGTHEIQISGKGLESGNARVEIAPQHTEEFGLDITVLAATAHTKQDVAIVSITDKSGAMIDAQDVFGRDVEFLIYSESARLSGAIQPTHSGSATIGGVLSKTDAITATMDGIDSASADILPAKIATSIELLAPEQVHIQEWFPFAVHAVDSFGVPLYKATHWKISSPLGVTIRDGYMLLENSGDAQASIISDVGASELELSGFANTMSVSLDIEKTDLRVGQQTVLKALNSVNASYTLITDHPYEHTAHDTFVITPDAEDESSTITVLATRDGYETVSISETISVKKIFSIDVTIHDAEGKRLAMPFDVTVGGSAIEAVSPYYSEFRPDDIEIAFSKKATAHSRGYTFEKMTVNAEEIKGNYLHITPTQDVRISASYNEEILIDVVDGQGSGVYKIGDIVEISAPDKDRVLFLIRDVFDHWKGIDADSSVASFVASQDMEIVAIYREDYTYLMALVVIPLVSGSILTLVKNTSSFRWIIQNLLEKIMGFIPNGKRDQGKSAKNQSRK